MTTPTAELRVSINNGAPTYGGIVVNPGDHVRLSAVSYAGWGSPAPRWEILTYPLGWSTPAGWSKDNTTGIIYYLGLTPPPFTLPSTIDVQGGLFGVWRFGLRVNGGKRPGLVDVNRTAVEIISLNGVRDTGYGERFEFDSKVGYQNKLAINNRLVDSVLGGGGGGGGLQLGVGTPLSVSAVPELPQLAGVGTTAARFDHSHSVYTAVPIAIGSSLQEGSLATLARSDHVHTLPESVLRAVAATLSDNISVNNKRITNVAAPSGASDAVNKSYADGLVSFTNVAAALAAANADISFNGVRLMDVANPSDDADATTKGHEDAREYSSSYKVFVRGASLANQTLSGPLTEDGITYQNGDLYLAKNQNTGSQNGIYVVNTGGAWARHQSMASNAHLTNGMVVGVREGTANASTGWILTTPAPITLNTTALSFTKIWQPTYTISNGLQLSGTTLSVKAASDGSVVVTGGGVGVGVLASDAQHGDRGGGNLHALAVAGSPGTAGFIGGVDLQALQSRTNDPTASTMVLRDANGGTGLEYIYAKTVLGAPPAQSNGMIRGRNVQMILAARNQANDADLDMISVGNDGVEIGNDAVATYVRATNGGTVTLAIKNNDLVIVSEDGVGFFGGGDFAGGENLISIAPCTTAPSATIAGTQCDVYNVGGALYAWGANNFGATLVPVVSGTSATLTREDKYVARRSQAIGNSVETLLDIPLRGATGMMEISFVVIGKVADANFARRRKVLLNNQTPGNIVQTDTIGTDVDTIAGGVGATFAISGSNYRITVTGSTTGSVKWAVFAHVCYHEP